MRRREFITLLGGAAAWPLAARAQQGERPRFVGVLMPIAETDPEAASRIAAVKTGLGDLGWNDGRNLRIEFRWAAGDVGRLHESAGELIRELPDVLLTNGTPAVIALAGQTSTTPIVFVNVADPVGAGFVKSFARPGGNITGFINYEGSIGDWWKMAGNPEGNCPAADPNSDHLERRECFI